MVKCNNCKFGKELYDITGDAWYYECTVDGDIINETIALDDTKDCDFYVHNRNDDTTKRP